MGAADERQLRFADLVHGGAAGPDAAAKCGYTGSRQSLSRAATRLMQRPEVVARLAALRAASASAAIAAKDEALRSLTEQLRFDLGPYIIFSEAGEYLRLDIEKLKKDGKTGLLHSIDVTKQTVGTTPGEEVIWETRTKLKLHDKHGAIDRLAKMLGWNAPEKVVHTGTLDVQGMTTEEVQKRARELLKKGAK